MACIWYVIWLVLCYDRRYCCCLVAVLLECESYAINWKRVRDAAHLHTRVYLLVNASRTRRQRLRVHIYIDHMKTTTTTTTTQNRNQNCVCDARRSKRRLIADNVLHTPAMPPTHSHTHTNSCTHLNKFDNFTESGAELC